VAGSLRKYWAYWRQGSRPSTQLDGRRRTRPKYDDQRADGFGGHSAVVAALHYRHATAERGKAIANYLDDVVKAAVSTPESTPVPLRS
jgi:hypothetical protein